MSKLSDQVKELEAEVERLRAQEPRSAPAIPEESRKVIQNWINEPARVHNVEFVVTAKSSRVPWLIETAMHSGLMPDMIGLYRDREIDPRNGDWHWVAKRRDTGEIVARADRWYNAPEYGYQPRGY